LLEFLLCHYLAQHIRREQEHIPVPYSVESDLAALTTGAKEGLKVIHLLAEFLVLWSRLIWLVSVIASQRMHD
jgi:hypothetical protein